MDTLFDISGKVAVVTGASSGLGTQFAKLLSSRGAKVIIMARRKERLDDLKAEIEADGGECVAIKCDVTNEDEIIAAVAEAKAAFGRIDILINNAGVGVGGKAEEQATELWTKTIDANLTGVYLVAREVGKVMIEQNYGKIVNLGSLHSRLAIDANVNGVSAYAASKGGVRMLTKALAAEWAKYNITVNALGPAYFPSEMTADAVATDAFQEFVAMRVPMGRFGRDGELNGAIIYFASDASSYTTGQLLGIDGGWTCT